MSDKDIPIINTKQNAITICGELYSGKSTAAKAVARILNYRHCSAGDFMRQMASERGVTLAELGSIAETDPGVDFEIDKMQRQFMAENNNYVIDSRIGWFFGPNTFKVYLDLDVRTAAERGFAASSGKELGRQVEGAYQSVEEVEASLLERFGSEQKRYDALYGITNYRDPQHFDLIINTRTNDAEATQELILEGYWRWLAS